jgi:hypothetical protein
MRRKEIGEMGIIFSGYRGLLYFFSEVNLMAGSKT